MNRSKLWRALSFLFPLSMYISTTGKTITGYADSAEMATSGIMFTAAHPPGYPLFIILAKLASFLPLGSPAFRVNLLTSFLGALTIFFVYLLFRKIGLPSLSALLASQTIAFAYSIWLYAITSEVFVLNNVFVIALVYLTLLWAQKRTQNKPDSDRILYLVAFVAGLGFSNHTSIILLFPSIFFLIFLIDPITIKRNFLKLTLCTIMGLTPYMQTIYSATTSHYPLFGSLPGLKRFLMYISRADYGGFFSAGTATGLTPTNYWGLFTYYLRLLFSNLSPLAPVLSLYLGIQAIKKRQLVFLFLTTFFLLTAVLFPLYALRNSAGTDLHELGVVERFGQLGFLATGITAILGLHLFLRNRFSQQGERVFQISLLLFSLFLLLKNYPEADKSNFTLTKTYALNILNQVEKNSIIMTSDDMTLFALYYFVAAEKVKPDIRLVNIAFLSSIWYQKELLQMWPDLYHSNAYYIYDVARAIIHSNQGVRPVYFVMLDDPYPLGFDGNPYLLTPRGLLLEADEATTDKSSTHEYQGTTTWQKYELVGLSKLYKDPFAQVVVNNYAFRFGINAKVYLKMGCLDCAKRELEQGLTVFPDNDDLKTTLSTLVVPQEKVKTTAADYLASAKQFISSSGYAYDLNYHRAIWDLEQAKTIDPSNEETHGTLAELYEYFGIYDKAIAEYEAAEKINPHSDWQERAEVVKKKAPKN